MVGCNLFKENLQNGPAIIEIEMLLEIDFDHDFDTDTDPKRPWFENKSAPSNHRSASQDHGTTARRHRLPLYCFAGRMTENSRSCSCRHSDGSIFPLRIDELIVDQVHSASVNRTLSQLYSAIMTTTLVHQFQRSQDEQGRLIAEIADYAIVQQLLNQAFIEGMAGGSAAQSDPKIQVIRTAKMIRPGDLAAELGLSKAAVTKWLNTDTGRQAVE